jgi:hypothetical protein
MSEIDEDVQKVVRELRLLFLCFWVLKFLFLFFWVFLISNSQLLYCLKVYGHVIVA